MRFQAGYILDGLSDIIKDNFQKESFFNDFSEDSQVNNLKGLLKSISCFDVSCTNSFEINYKAIHPVLATINNIITRGLPTRAPLRLEQLFVALGLNNIREDKPFEYRFSVDKNFIQFKDIFELLHILTPKLDIQRAQYGGELDSNLEWNFIERQPIFKQILQCQRAFSTLNKKVQGNRRFDFTFTIPYAYYVKDVDSYEYKTIVYEVDGNHHLLKEFLIYDAQRDALVREVNADIVRFSSFEIHEKIKHIEDEFDPSILKIFEKNYQRNFVEDSAKYYLTLMPFAVARIQKTLLEIFIREPKFLAQEKLIIAVIERDIPAAAIALADLKDMFEHINSMLLEVDKLHFPEITLTIFQDEKLIFDPLVNLGVDTLPLEQFNPTAYDFVIDNSILIREGVLKHGNERLANYFTVRSSHYIDTTVAASRLVYCAPSLHYKPFVTRNDDTSYTPIKEMEGAITFFLNQLFRKKEFREGQLPIISRALQKLPVIGLLPTGGGKSLTFQIPAFLQPTLVIVVDPIKSLMEDQVRVLKENWIDTANYANSSLSTLQKNRNIVNFYLSNSQFLFVSPERFVIDEFRKGINKLHYYGLGQSIGYCVIDEVHCVSEWGHDFRYDYLMLGENAQKYAYSRDENQVSLIGLTATASFDVLADIERELKIQSTQVSDAIIMIENTVRPELFFRVVDVTDIEDRSQTLIDEITDFEKAFTYYNNEGLLRKSQLHHFNNFDARDFCLRDNTGKIVKKDDKLVFSYNPTMLLEPYKERFSSVVFCAIKGEMQDKNGGYYNNKGVRYVHQALQNQGISTGYYFGANRDDEQANIQANFVGFTTGKIDHMVCTKAFGMGIDKDDIRATFHINYASSLESLVQECGRGGRDKKVAVATILASNKTYCVFDIIKLKEMDRRGSNIFTPFDIIIIRYSLVQYKSDENSKYADRTFKNKEEALDFALNIDYSFSAKNGKMLSLSEDKKMQLRKFLIDNIDSIVQEKSEDRDIHDFFYNRNYKGMDFEQSHAFNLFYKKEFEANDFEQLSLKEEFLNCQEEELTYYLKFSNNYNNQHMDVVNQCISIDMLTNQLKKSKDDILAAIEMIFKTAASIEEFWFKMENERIVNFDTITEKSKKSLEKAYLRNRGETETGRLIYRLHCIGLLKSYTKDYNKQLYKCILFKKKAIKEYLDSLEQFLRRYQSEQTVQKNMAYIETRLQHDPKKIVDDIIELLFYIAEFTYQEIASKRKRGTDEIKRIIEYIIENKNGWDEFENNRYLKEEIYYYFNAKYARPNYIENGIDCSLLDEYQSYQEGKRDPEAVLLKFIDADILRNGTEQNNYKHLIGSCKKILFSLTEADLKTEWVLRLLNAFALYSANNISYRSDANKIVEIGFHKLFEDKVYHTGNYDIIQNVFTLYFEKLLENIDAKNPILIDIDLIKNKLLQDLQLQAVNELLTKYYTKELIHE